MNWAFCSTPFNDPAVCELPAGGRPVRSLMSGLNEAGKLIEHNTQTTWVNAPDGIGNLQAFRRDQHQVSVIIEADTLHAATSSLSC